jgi:hypothetical protein
LTFGVEAHLVAGRLDVYLVKARAPVVPSPNVSRADGVGKSVAKYPRTRRLLIHEPTVAQIVGVCACP